MTHERLARGFSKGVNEYLSVSVALADAKAAALLAASLTLGVAAVQLKGGSGIALVSRIVAVAALAASVATSAFVITPRLHSSRHGLIFWEDIRGRQRLEDYVGEAAQLTEGQAETEYATQNYFISEVLHRKHVWVRRGIALFLVGVASTAVAYLSS
jgi:hypothetical protein